MFTGLRGTSHSGRSWKTSKRTLCLRPEKHLEALEVSGNKRMSSAKITVFVEALHWLDCLNNDGAWIKEKPHSGRGILER